MIITYWLVGFFKVNEGTYYVNGILDVTKSRELAEKFKTIDAAIEYIDENLRTLNVDTISIIRVEKIENELKEPSQTSMNFENIKYKITQGGA